MQNIQGLTKAYEKLAVGACSLEEAISHLNPELSARIENIVERFMGSAIPLRMHYQEAIRSIALDFYRSSRESLQDRIHQVFSQSYGESFVADPCWGRDHIQDPDKTESMLNALELTALNDELERWAGNCPNSIEAKTRIEEFINISDQKNLNFFNLELESLPDIFRYSQFNTRLIELGFLYNKPKSLPDLAGLTCLTTLGLSHNQLPSLPHLNGLTSLINLHLQHNNLQSLPDLTGLVSLRELDVFFNQLQSLPESIGNLTRLTYLNASHNKLQSIPESTSNLRSLKRLDLFENQLQSIPESIENCTKLTFLQLSNMPNLYFLPNSILRLSSHCSVFIERTALSFQVLDRLQRATSQEGYAGPRFFFSIQDNNRLQQQLTLGMALRYLFTKAKMEGFTAFESTYPNISQYVSENNKTDSLRSWLSRLALMQPNKRDGKEGLSRQIISYLYIAERDENFRHDFFAIIHGAGVTCGDRVALSVLYIGIKHRMATIDKSKLSEYAQFLIHGPWMLDQIEGIARAKVETLRFVDEIEVYLGFPVKLRERLNLQIDVENMLYFACSGINQSDLDNAASFIETQIPTLEAKANILVHREDWIEALRQSCPEEIKSIEKHRDERLESSDGSDIELQNIQKDYLNNLVDLTKRFIR